MQINWLGHSSFLLKDNTGASILTDPYDKYVGRQFPKVSADIVVISHKHKDHSAIEQVQSFNKIIDSEEFFCYNDIIIKSFYRYHDNKCGALRGKTLITKIQTEQLTLCHMGDIGEDCSNEIVDEIGKVDILFIPVGGTYTIDCMQAKIYIEKINPKVVIPMHFKNKFCVFPIDGVDRFVALFDKSIVKTIQDTTLNITKEMLDKEKFNIILMQIA